MPSGYWHYITYLDGGFAVSYRKIAQTLRLKLWGLFCLVAYMPFDKFMNFLMGKDWLIKKEHIAEMRANKAILKKMYESGELDLNTGRAEKPYFNTQLRTGHH